LVQAGAARGSPSRPTGGPARTWLETVLWHGRETRARRPVARRGGGGEREGERASAREPSRRLPSRSQDRRAVQPTDGPPCSGAADRRWYERFVTGGSGGRGQSPGRTSVRPRERERQPRPGDWRDDPNAAQHRAPARCAVAGESPRRPPERRQRASRRPGFGPVSQEVTRRRGRPDRPTCTSSRPRTVPRHGPAGCPAQGVARRLEPPGRDHGRPPGRPGWRPAGRGAGTDGVSCRGPAGASAPEGRARGQANRAEWAGDRTLRDGSPSRCACGCQAKHRDHVRMRQRAHARFAWQGRVVWYGR
jgi:hypothetical protein